MTDNDQLIENQIKKLQNPKASIRYEACEFLRVAPTIPPEAIQTLQKALEDPDASVAEAARRALAVHLPKATVKEKRGDNPAIFSVMAVIIISTVCWIFICVASGVFEAIPNVFFGQAILSNSETLVFSIAIGLAAPITGIMGGLAQLIIIKPARAHWFYWLLISMIGWALGAVLCILVVLVLGMFVKVTIYPMTFLILLPAAMIFSGFGQWLILRKYIARAWRWMVATAVTGLLAGIVMLPYEEVDVSTGGESAGLFYALSLVICVIAAGAVIGFITGTAAVKLGLHISKPGTEVST